MTNVAALMSCENILQCTPNCSNVVLKNEKKEKAK